MTDESKNTKRPRGRPKGAINTVEPRGARRAREYFDLTDTGEKPSHAADKVAERYGVSAEAIFHDIKRHEQRIAAEIRRQADDLEHELREKAAGLVDRAAVDGAWLEVLGLIDECFKRRLSSAALAKTLAGMDVEEAEKCLSGTITDMRLELVHRFTERAEELSRAPHDGKYPLVNGAMLVFEVMAKGIKPNLK